MKNRKNQKGFTLMELMVVIVIVAILAAVAVPLYINYVNDARRTEAKGAIAAVISAEQVWFQEHSKYEEDISKLNVDIGDVARNWEIDVTDADETSFTVIAKGKDAGAAKDLNVQCVYDRSTGATWKDEIVE